MLAQTEVMHRTWILKRNSLSESQTFLAEAIETKPGCLAGEKDAKVEHFTGIRVKLGVGRERTGVV